MQTRNCNSRVLVILLAACASAMLAGPGSPAHQPPGTVVVDASEFYDQIPAGDTIGGGFGNASTAWLFNNSVIDLVSKEDAVAKATIPEAGAYRLFVRSQGTATSGFKVSVDGQTRRGRVRQRAARLEGQRHVPTEEGHGGDSPHRHQPAAHARRAGALEEPNFEEKDLKPLELPEEVELLKDYTIPAANIVKFGDVDGDGKPDFLVITSNYSAYMYNNDGKELWHWDAPAEGARLRGEFEAPGSIWDFDQDGYAEVVHWRIIDGKEWLVMADGRTGAIKHKVEWPTPPLPHVYNNFRTAIAKFHPGYADNLLVFTDSGGTISLTAYDRELKQIWQHTEQRKKDFFGHYIYPIDLNGDGIDEVLLSHLCLDSKGNTIWNNYRLFDDNHDHMDAMEFFDINGDGKLELITGQSDVGALAYRGDDRGDAVAEPGRPHAADHRRLHPQGHEDPAGGGQRPHLRRPGRSGRAALLVR